MNKWEGNVKESKNTKFNDEWIKMPKWKRQKGEMAFKNKQQN